MFHSIPAAIQSQMERLERIDAQDRVDGTPRMKRLRQIPPSTGKLLAILAAGAPPGEIVEIGTSAGYSSLWLALACRASRRTFTTFEVLDDKAALAEETFRASGVEDVIRLVKGDFLERQSALDDIAFCFLDAEKDVYASCYEMVVPHLVPGGLLIADNAINHRAILEPMLNRALADERVDALIAQVDNGLLICRKI